jgi:hypothetical protein
MNYTRDSERTSLNIVGEKNISKGRCKEKGGKQFVSNISPLRLTVYYEHIFVLALAAIEFQNCLVNNCS